MAMFRCRSPVLTRPTLSLMTSSRRIRVRSHFTKRDYWCYTIRKIQETVRMIQSDLSTEQLIGRARRYRDMARTARAVGSMDDLLRLAERFEALAKSPARAAEIQPSPYTNAGPWHVSPQH